MTEPSPNLQDHLRQAIAAYQAGQLGKAAALCAAVIQQKSDELDALHLLGVVQYRLGNLPEAVRNYDRALAINPFNAQVLSNRGAALHQLGRFAEAAQNYQQALALRPDALDVLLNQGATLQALGRFGDALASYDKALAIKPDLAEAFYNRADPLLRLQRFEEALASYERALEIRPDHPDAFSRLAFYALRACDWKRTAALAREIDVRSRRGNSLVAPFVLLAYCGDPALQASSIKNYVRHVGAAGLQPIANGAREAHDKIRIAYVSGEFYQHATAFLVAELFEIHDRSEFEVTAISYGRDDRSAVRTRLINGVDQFHDVRSKSNHEAARLIRQLGIDIAIDLNGYHFGARPGILAHRPAPVQVNYLGFAGTMAADFIDYVIGDPIVLPLEQQAFFTEKIVQLPDCYQVNDSTRQIAAQTPARTDVGLPADGFVFCCFNDSYKITPPVFDVWMRVLAAVEGSVLWLLRGNPLAEISRQKERNLRNAAAGRGIDPARLVFADHVEQHHHLARHRLADLFLDTLPYNAHATASDALWAGLPLLTCLGGTFTGRVAASVLAAVGLPELITGSLDEYEALAIRLATDPSLLRSLRGKLEINRLAHPLFDTQRFRRHLEAAYRKMWEIQRCGEPPRGFRVEPIDV